MNKKYFETLKSINDQAMEMPKERIAFAFAQATVLCSTLTTVLETYIGTDNVIRLANNPDDDELVESLMGAIKGNTELWHKVNAALEGDANNG